MSSKTVTDFSLQLAPQLFKEHQFHQQYDEKVPEAKYDIMSYIYSPINDTEDLVNVGHFIPRALMDPEFTHRSPVY